MLEKNELQDFRLAFITLRDLCAPKGDQSYFFHYKLLESLERDGIVSFASIGTSHEKLMELCLKGSERLEREARLLRNILNKMSVSIDGVDLIIDAERKIQKKIKEEGML